MARPTADLFGFDDPTDGVPVGLPDLLNLGDGNETDSDDQDSSDWDDVPPVSIRAAANNPTSGTLPIAAVAIGLAVFAAGIAIGGIIGATLTLAMSG